MHHLISQEYCFTYLVAAQSIGTIVHTLVQILKGYGKELTTS